MNPDDKGQAAIEALISVMLFCGAVFALMIILKTGLNHIKAIIMCRRTAAVYFDGISGLPPKAGPGTTVRIVPDRLFGAIRIETSIREKWSLPVVESLVMEKPVYRKLRQ